MCTFHHDPIRLRLPDEFFLLEVLAAGTEVYHVSDIHLFHQDGSDGAVVPSKGVLQNPIRNKLTKLLMKISLRTKDLLSFQFAGNLAAGFSLQRHPKDFPNDRTVLVRHQFMPVCGITIISIGRIRTGILPSKRLGFKG